MIMFLTVNITYSGKNVNLLSKATAAINDEVAMPYTSKTFDKGSRLN